MIMTQNHLHELLKEDQEPFLLQSYIAEKRHLLKNAPSKPHLVKSTNKRKPISEISSKKFPEKFCRNACIFSFSQYSPDLRKSPLFEFQPMAKSPCRDQHTIFHNIPANTAALLVEAALRIHKQSTSSKSSSQSKQRNGFGLFGSFFKRLTHRNRTQKCGIESDKIKLSVKDIIKMQEMEGRDEMVVLEKESPFEMGFSCSCNGERCTSAVWSESNEEKSTELETSSSSNYSEYPEEIIGFGSDNQRNKTTFDYFDNDFCRSPFRFVLQPSLSPGRRTPELSSPLTSRNRHKTEEEKNCEEEESKDQCSPVSVLDPPFEDDDDRHAGDDEEKGYNIECSVAIVQKTKKLLNKLRRFEKLAELDPVELEKRILEGEQDDTDTDHLEEQECESTYGSVSSSREDMKRLVSDLINEEVRDKNGFEKREEMVKRVYKKLESWKEVEPNTINMMVEQDYMRDIDLWKQNKEQFGEITIDIELAIFGFLVDEFATELVCLTPIRE